MILSYYQAMKSLFYLLCLIFAHNVLALETDQFIANDAHLKDASDVMNDYFQDSIERALVKSNQKNLSCEDVALKIMQNATGKFSISKASTYASKTPLIERFPEDNISERKYIQQSFYQHAWLPLKTVFLARTININGIHLGTDKFGHFTHMGMNYYKTYLKLIANGVSPNEAIERAIIKGFGSEYGILGYGIGGVMSFGDLEANYQGLMFALDMCRGDKPILVFKNNSWIENPEHRFDIRDYFTPQMDESFNMSFWRKPLYKKIKDKLIAEYCSVQETKNYQERIQYYRSILKNNLNDVLIKKNILSQKKYARENENIENQCQKK